MKIVSSVLLRHRTAVSAVVNLGIAAGAYALAFGLRFDMDVPAPELNVFLTTLPLLLACRFVGFQAYGLLSGWWRHVSLRDAVDIVQGNALGTGVFLVALVSWRGLEGYPRSIVILDFLLCTTAIVGFRAVIRLVREYEGQPPIRRIDTLALIVGAGNAGIQLVQEMQHRRHHRIAVVGFVDDDPSKQGCRVCGARVLGRTDDIPRLVATHGITEVLIAIPSAPGAVIRRIVQRCTDAGVRHRVVPSLGELVEGHVMLTQVRDVKVDDLLSRAPVQLDDPRVRSLVRGATVLITGAAGSIGSELCRQVAAHGPGRLVLFDRHENGIFNLEIELQQRFPRVPIVPVLGDVLLDGQLARVFAEERPTLVFHAAAYKHVPLAERNVLEAVRNNVVGTLNVARAALAAGVAEFVLVSTDKAVRPTSVMGVTKRVAELVVQGLQNGHGRFVVVRFGNVLGSSGSVVPLFREQIARGGPVTVTDPRVTRYFMTIPEASQLILEAAALGQGGEVFLLEMGEPVRIVDLARQMIRLSGFVPDEDIPVEFIGLRPGEKLEEQLTDEDETSVSIHDRLRVVQRRGRAPSLATWLPILEAALHRSDVAAVVALLGTLVPSYRPSELVRTIVAVPAPAADAPAAVVSTAA